MRYHIVRGKYDANAVANRKEDHYMEQRDLRLVNNFNLFFVISNGSD